MTPKLIVWFAWPKVKTFQSTPNLLFGLLDPKRKVFRLAPNLFCFVWPKVKQSNFKLAHYLFVLLDPKSRYLRYLRILNVKCVILRLLSTPVTVTYALCIYVKLVPFKSSFLVQGPFFQYLTKNLVPFWSPFSQKSGPFLVP